MYSLQLPTRDLRIIFKVFDRDNNGVIEYNELMHVVRNPDLIAEQISRLSQRKRFGTSSSSSLKNRLREEKRRLKMVKEVPKRMLYQFKQNLHGLKDAFKKFDSNGDGVPRLNRIKKNNQSS